MLSSPIEYFLLNSVISHYDDLAEYECKTMFATGVRCSKVIPLNQMSFRQWGFQRVC